MSVLRVFLTADSEFAIENLPKPKGNPEIDAREKRTLFSQFTPLRSCVESICRGLYKFAAASNAQNIYSTVTSQMGCRTIHDCIQIAN